MRIGNMKKAALKRIISARNRFINIAGCVVAKWILHNFDDGFVIKRKGGAEQIIKVFSVPVYKNIIKPAIHKATEVIKVGDVVTDNGYHGEVVITCITNGFFKGYYRADGFVVSGLELKDFKKVIGHVDLKVKEY